MNSAWAAALAAIGAGVVTLLCNWALVAYYFGKLVERVDGHSATMADLKASDVKQSAEIAVIDKDVAVLKGQGLLRDMRRGAGAG